MLLHEAAEGRILNQLGSGVITKSEDLVNEGVHGAPSTKIRYSISLRFSWDL